MSWRNFMSASASARVSGVKSMSGVTGSAIGEHMTALAAMRPKKILESILKLRLVEVVCKDCVDVKSVDVSDWRINNSVNFESLYTHRSGRCGRVRASADGLAPHSRTIFAPQTWTTPMESLERWHDTVHLMIMVRTKIYPTMNLADTRIPAGARDSDIEETTIR